MFRPVVLNWAILPPTGHMLMSGDFFDSYTKDALCIQQVEIRDSAEHTVRYRTALHSKDNVA